MTISSPINTALRGVQAGHALIVLGLSLFVSYTTTSNPFSIPYLTIPSSVSLLTLNLIHLTPSTAKHSGNILIAEGLVTHLYLIDSISLSVYLSKLDYCQGPVCAIARADVVFAAFGYAIWAASTTICGMEMSKARREVENARDRVEEKASVECVEKV